MTLSAGARAGGVETEGLLVPPVPYCLVLYPGARAGGVERQGLLRPGAPSTVLSCHVLYCTQEQVLVGWRRKGYLSLKHSIVLHCPVLFYAVPKNTCWCGGDGRATGA